MTAYDPSEVDRVLPNVEYNEQSAYNVGWYSTVNPEERYIGYVIAYNIVSNAVAKGTVEDVADWTLALVAWASEDDLAAAAGLELTKDSFQLAQEHNRIYGTGESGFATQVGTGFPKIDTDNPEAYRLTLRGLLFPEAEDAGAWEGIIKGGPVGYLGTMEDQRIHPRHQKQQQYMHLVDGGVQMLREALGKIPGAETLIGEENPFRANPSGVQFWDNLDEHAYGPTAQKEGHMNRAENVARVAVDAYMFRMAAPLITGPLAMVGGFLKNATAGEAGYQAIKTAKVTQAIVNGVGKLKGVPGVAKGSSIYGNFNKKTKYAIPAGGYSLAVNASEVVDGYFNNDSIRGLFAPEAWDAMTEAIGYENTQQLRGTGPTPNPAPYRQDIDMDRIREPGPRRPPSLMPQEGDDYNTFLNQRGPS